MENRGANSDAVAVAAAAMGTMEKPLVTTTTTTQSASLEKKVAELEREKTEAMASVGALVVEREKLRVVNTEIEAAFDELHTRYNALTSEQTRWKQIEAQAAVEKARMQEDMAARDDEILRLESEVAELRKRRALDATKVGELRDNLDSAVAEKIGAQQEKWRAQAQEMVAAYQEESQELEVFNDVLKAKASARTLESNARAEQVEALVAENSQLRVALELLCEKVGSMSVEPSGAPFLDAYTPAPETL